jgi:hypothetical protein
MCCQPAHHTCHTPWATVSTCKGDCIRSPLWLGDARRLWAAPTLCESSMRITSDALQEGLRPSCQWQSVVHWYGFVGTVPDMLTHELSTDRRGGWHGTMCSRTGCCYRCTGRWQSACVGCEGQRQGRVRQTPIASRTTHQLAVCFGWRHPPRRRRLLCSDPTCSISSALSIG